MNSTNHYDAFVVALRENPGDTATRLIFADWLEECGGKPEAARWLRETAGKEPGKNIHISMYAWSLTKEIMSKLSGQKLFTDARRWYGSRNAALLDLIQACLAMDEPEKCELCEGRGRVRAIPAMTCPACSGSGKQSEPFSATR